MDCSTPGFPVHHQLPKFTQSHVHWVVMPSNHLILCFPLLLPPSTFPNIRVFSNELALRIMWPKGWSFSCNISPSNEYSELISFRMDWLNLFAVQDSQESFPTPQFKSINSSAPSFIYSPTLTSIHDYWKNHNLDSMDLCIVIFHCSLIRIFLTTNIFNTFACWYIFLVKNFFWTLLPILRAALFVEIWEFFT